MASRSDHEQLSASRGSHQRSPRALFDQYWANIGRAHPRFGKYAQGVIENRVRSVIEKRRVYERTVRVRRPRMHNIEPHTSAHRLKRRPLQGSLRGFRFIYPDDDAAIRRLSLHVLMVRRSLVTGPGQKVPQGPSDRGLRGRPLGALIIGSVAQQAAHHSQCAIASGGARAHRRGCPLHRCRAARPGPVGGWRGRWRRCPPVGRCE